jgi:hypothetical protein
MAVELTYYPEPPLRYGTQQGALQGSDLGTELVTVGASASTAVQVPADARFVVVTTAEDEPCRIAFGAASDVAADNAEPGISRLLKADAEYAFLVAGGSYVSVIQATP